MPQWAGSCWYYLRYLDPKNTDVQSRSRALLDGRGRTRSPEIGRSSGMWIFTSAAPNTPCLHLLYARFWHKVLFDLGHVSTPEPFFKLVNQG